MAGKQPQRQRSLMEMAFVPSTSGPVPLAIPRKVQRQATIGSMAGVVKMQHSSLAFGDDDLRRLKNRLDDTNTSDKERMDILRTLDSMVIGLDRLRASGIGKTISRLAKQPSNLQQLARRLKDKWRRIVLGGSAMLSAGTQLEGRVKEEKQARLERDKRLRQATAIEDVSS